MRLKVIKKLVDINILYAIQTSQLQQYRKKQAKNPEVKVNVSLQAIRMYLILGLVYLFIFGIMSAFNRMVGNPGLFANMVSIFAMFSMSQGFLVFYNVFYESKDLQSYRPYAFSESEIIVGKSISVVLTLLIAILPMYSYFIVLGLQGRNPLVGLPMALISIVILSSVLTFVILILVHFITKTAFFRKYKTILSNVILGIVSLGSVGLYIFINQMNSRSIASNTMATPYFPPVVAFYDFIINPFSLTAVLGILAWLAVAAFLFLLVKFKVIPEFYEAALMTGAAGGKRERVHDINMDEAKNFKKFVWRYHLRLLSEGSVVLQALFMSALIPYIIIFSMVMGTINAGLDISPFLIPRYLLPLIFLSMFIATLNSGGNNLTSIGLSLERENFDYLKVLPFDLRKYIRLKFWYLFAIQSILPVILLFVTSLLFHIHLVTFLGMLLTWFMASLAWSAWGYHRDYKHLVTNWSNVNELMNRDNSMGKTLLALLFTFGIIIVIGLFYMISYFLPLTVLYFLSAVLILVSGLISYLTYRDYMRRLDKEIVSFY